MGFHGECGRILTESVDVFMQLALWEEYADEVEEQMRVLLADNALLQAALADVRSSLSHERPSSTSGTGLTSISATSQPMPMRQCTCKQCIRHQSCIVHLTSLSKPQGKGPEMCVCMLFPSALGCIIAADWSKKPGALCRAERI